VSSNKSVEIKFPSALIPLRDYHDGPWLANALEQLTGQEIVDEEIAFKHGYYWFQFSVK